MSFNSRLQSVLKLKTVAIIASVVTLIITVSLVIIVNNIQNYNQKIVLESAASRQADLLRDQVNSDINFIGSVANFFQSSLPSNWDHFECFAKEVVGSSKSLISLEWLNRVTPGNIENYIKNQKITYPDFDIYTIENMRKYHFKGGFGNDNAIYVVSDIYPLSKSNLETIGYYSVSDREQSFINNIKKTKQPNVSDRVTLLSDTFELMKSNTAKHVKTKTGSLKKNKRGLLIYYPVFDADGKKMIGIVIGVVDLTVYMNSVIHRSLNGISSEIKIVDTDKGADDSPLMYKSINWDKTQGTALVRKVILPNRTWLVEFKPLHVKEVQDTLGLIGILISGIVISILVFYIVSFQSGENERIETQLKIKTKELQFLVGRDALTKLRNRRSFNKHIDTMISTKTPFTLISMDIDKFKSINDDFGHMVGDQALIHVAEIVPTLLTTMDKFYRLGGDEFSIITTQTNSQILENLLSAICRKVNHTIIQYKNDEIYCSLSIGAAICHENDDIESLMTRTDSALYESKNKGKNCFTLLE